MSRSRCKNLDLNCVVCSLHSWFLALNFNCNSWRFFLIFILFYLVFAVGLPSISICTDFVGGDCGNQPKGLWFFLHKNTCFQVVVKAYRATIFPIKRLMQAVIFLILPQQLRRTFPCYFLCICFMVSCKINKEFFKYEDLVAGLMWPFLLVSLDLWFVNACSARDSLTNLIGVIFGFWDLLNSSF